MDNEKKSRQKKGQSEAERCERHIEGIVISLVEGFTLVPDSHKLVSELESGLMVTTGVEEALSVIAGSLKQFMKRIETILVTKSNEGILKGVESTKSNLVADNSESESCYLGLEKLVQKYESDIRDHIRIEQELRLYSEDLAERMTEVTSRSKDLKKKVSKLEMQVQDLRIKLSTATDHNNSLNKRISKNEGRRASNSFNASKRIGNLSAEVVSLQELEFPKQRHPVPFQQGKQEGDHKSRRVHPEGPRRQEPSFKIQM
jgi:chromosome segregation ATPase